MRSFVALCKTFRGSEWIMPMTMSIYPHVEKLVFVNSEVSWTGGRGNTCKPVIKEMQRTMDPEHKIISLDLDTTDQFLQCEHGYQWILNHERPDFVLLADTDEIWNDADLIKAKDYIEKNPNYDAYRHNIYTYIKHPLYRIDPIECLQPVSFVNTYQPNLGTNFRACDMNFHVIPDVYFHHYVHVRKEFNTVLEKIITSHASEGDPYQDMSRWIPEVWNKLPHIEGEWAEKGFHPNAKFRHLWRGIRQITPEEMPRVLREHNFPILEQFGIRTK